MDFSLVNWGSRSSAARAIPYSWLHISKGKREVTHKTLTKIAVLMIVIFGLTVLMYPGIFSPDQTPSVAPQIDATGEEKP